MNILIMDNGGSILLYEGVEYKNMFVQISMLLAVFWHGTLLHSLKF